MRVNYVVKHIIEYICLNQVYSENKGSSRILTMGQTQATTRINIKEQQNDQQTCDVKDICQLSDGRFLVTDHANNRLKLLGVNYALVASLATDGSPFGACEGEPGQAIVTSQFIGKTQDSVVLIAVGKSLSINSYFNVDYRCYGIAYAGGRVYVCMGSRLNVSEEKSSHVLRDEPDNLPGHVRVFSLSGEVLQTIPNDLDLTVFSEPRYIQWSRDTKEFHVSDLTKGVVTIDTQEEVHYTVPKQSDFTSPQGLCENINKDIIVCESKSHALVQMTLSAKQVKVTIHESERLERPQAVCFDNKRNNLLVACQMSDVIEIFNAT